MELSVVHDGRECTKHARLATSQGIEQANRDDPHCSAAGTAVLSSPDEVLRCPLIFRIIGYLNKTQRPVTRLYKRASARQNLQ